MGSAIRDCRLAAGPARNWPLVTLTLFVTLAHVSLGSALPHSGWPTVHLQTDTIHTHLAPQGLSSSSQRRRLLQHDYHTHHASWGLLHSAHQALVSHVPGLHHHQRQALVDHAEAAGAQVMGYIPDDTLLLVGPPQALEAAANHSLMLWSGPHEPHYKVALEWELLLHHLEGLVTGLGPEKSSSRGVGGAVNMTTVHQLQLAAALQKLPVRSRHVPGEWPLVGVQALFPSVVLPQPHAAGHPHAQRHAARIARLAQHQQETHGGAAAVADWTPLLRDLFGDSIQVQSGGPHQALLFVPPQQLRQVIDWLTQRPAVHWVAPLSRQHASAREATCITQSSKPAPTTPKTGMDPSLHPVWAAGITGKNQVVGIGDSGLDRYHCFFYDPNVDFVANTKVVDRVRTFASTEHRKIRLYRALSDFSDANGHGTHTSGTLAGMPYGATLDDVANVNVGMAPDAKLAFLDLSAASDGDSIRAPADLANNYFKYTAEVGAAIHSDSWGSSSILYDTDAAQVDAYCWQRQEFLPVFPAGNEGDRRTNYGSSGDTTVQSPATSKNCMAAGATQTTLEGLQLDPSDRLKVWTAKASSAASLQTTFPVLEATFSSGVGVLGSKPYALVPAVPLTGCTNQMDNSADLAGAVALIERGNCTFEAKARAAQEAGAAAAIFFDNEVGAYFTPTASPDGSVITIPAMFIPRRVGQNLLGDLTIGRAINLTFVAAREPSYGFDNLAFFSSQGPVGRDKRVKPDIVAPGTITSAATSGASGKTSCGVVTYGGTSMATPVVAGSAALVKQYYEDGYYPSGVADPANAFRPSASLLKATMLTGAAPLQGYESDTGLPIDPPPSFRQGYGRVFLGASLLLQGNPYSPANLQVVDAVPINSGEVHQYCVTATGGALTVTLVWTDYPGSPMAARSLVNDLDLTVRAQGLNGIPLLGNGGDVENSTLPDSVNNVEQVSAGSVPQGQVSIEVRASSVYAAAGPQPYALVVSGEFTGALSNPTADGAGNCAVVVAVITAGPSGVTNNASPTFEFSTQGGTAKGVAFQCRLADGQGGVGAAGTADWAACSTPTSYKSLPDGAYTFSVRARGEDIDTSQAFQVDSTPPTVTLTASTPPTPLNTPGPAPAPATTSQPTATFAFASTDSTAVAYSCQLSVSEGAPQQGALYAGSTVGVPVMPGAAFNCTSPQTLAWLLPGQWEFVVAGTDAAGNQAKGTSFAWQVALAAGKQYARITAGPLLTVASRDVTFDLAALASSQDGAASPVQGAATECALVQGAAGSAPASWAACASPAKYALPADGGFTFLARVVGDPAAGPTADGAYPDTWAVSTFAVDSTPPTVAITEGPGNGAAVGSQDVTFAFQLSEEGGTASCTLTGQGGSAPAPSNATCVSPAHYYNLTSGRYSLALTPRDAVGNVGPPVTTDFVIDTTAPAITEVQLPQATTADSVQVAFVSSDGEGGSGVKNVSCRARPLALVPPDAAKVNLDDARWDWAPCTSPWAVSGLVEGHWSLGLRAYDNAGLASQPAEFDMWVDTKAPVVNITAGPPKNAVMSGGDVTFNISDASLAGSLEPTAGSPVQWQGNLRSLTAEEYQQIVSGGGGIAPNGKGGDGAVSTQNTKTLASKETPAPVLGSDDLGGWANCSSTACMYRGLGGGSYVFTARGVDAAGNAGDVSPPYAFQAGGASSSGLPTWALATIGAVGGVAVILALAALWCCCCRKRQHSTGGPVAAARPPMGSIPSTAAAPYPYGGYQQQPYANGGSGLPAYPPPQAAYAQPYGAAYPPPQYPSQTSRLATDDPIEAQQLALALAASEAEARRQREAAAQGTQWLAVNSAAAPAQHDDELRAAMEASLREQQRQARPASAGDSDAELAAAIEASLRDQRATPDEELRQSPSAPAPSVYASSSDWAPPPRW